MASCKALNIRAEPWGIAGRGAQRCSQGMSFWTSFLMSPGPFFKPSSYKKGINVFWLHCVACGILVSQPRMEPMAPPVIECGVLTTGSPGRSQGASIVFFIYCLPSGVALCIEHNPPETEGRPQHQQAFLVSSGCNTEQSGSMNCFHT